MEPNRSRWVLTAMCATLATSLLAFIPGPVMADPVLPLSRLPICGDQGNPEVPVVLHCGDLGQLADAQTLRVTGSAQVAVSFRFAFREAGFNNELGVFLADDVTGSVGQLAPGDPGYLAAAFSRAAILFPSGSTPSSPDVTVTLIGGDTLVFFIVQNGTLADLLAQNPENLLELSPLAFFSIDRLNPDGFDHFIVFDNAATGYTQIGFEDMTHGGDADYDDVVFNVVPRLVPGDVRGEK